MQLASAAQARMHAICYSICALLFEGIDYSVGPFDIILISKEASAFVFYLIFS